MGSTRGTKPLSASAERAIALLEALRQCRSDIESLLASLTPQDLALSSTCPGWSVRDEIGHIVDSTEMLAEGLEKASAGEREGSLQLREMAPAMQTRAIERVALLPLSQIQIAYRDAADRLLALLEKRDRASWDEEVPHPYLGSCSAVQVAGQALLDWFIHPWDIREALELKPQPRAGHAALLIPGIVSMMPKRFNASRARNQPARFRYIVVTNAAEGAEESFSLDLVLVKGEARVEKEVDENVPADVTFKGPAGELALAMLGRRGLSKFALPSPANETWLPRWPNLWISL